MRWLVLAAVLLSLAGPLVCQAQSVPSQQDTTSATARHRPRAALIRAALLPGWGQIYNHQFYKLPFVYGGLAGLVGGMLYMNHEYRRFRHIYLYALYPDQFPQYADQAAPYQRYIDSGQSSLFKTQREKFRRNRDLLIIGIGLFYGFTVLDAFVSAHLRDFDVGEDLSLQVRPDILSLAPGRPAAVVRLRF